MLERLPWFRCYPADYLLDTMSLTMEQHGAYWLLITHYYWNGSIPPKVEDVYALIRADNEERKQAVDLVLARYFIKDEQGFRHSRIERELEKLGSMLRNQSKAGKASALARTPRNKKINGSEKTQKSQLQDNSRQTAKRVLAFLNESTGKKFQEVEANIKPIIARLKDFDENTLRSIVVLKCEQWAKDEKMCEYLRPATLFNATNCAQYAGELT